MDYVVLGIFGISAGLIGALVGIMGYYIIGMYRGSNCAKLRDLRELEYDLHSLEDRFKRFQSKHLLSENRKAKKEEMNLLKEHLPLIIENLPIDENVKNAIKNLPPDLLISGLKELSKYEGVE